MLRHALYHGLSLPKTKLVLEIDVTPWRHALHRELSLPKTKLVLEIDVTPWCRGLQAVVLHV